MEKIIHVDGKDLKFKATALTPVRYHQKFGSDMIVDISKITDAFDGKTLPPHMLEKFGQIAYTMHKQGDPEQPDDWEEWLDQFEIFSIVEVLPQMFELWAMNTKQTSKQKKSPDR